jgi:hypothetical protein
MNRTGSTEPGAGRLRMALAGATQDRGQNVRYLGVALDWDVEAGLRMLRRMGRFDEVSAGGGWTNSAVFQFLWQDSLAVAAIPQLILLERTLRISPAGQDMYLVSARVLQKALGVDGIVRWLDSRARATAQ